MDDSSPRTQRSSASLMLRITFLLPLLLALTGMGFALAALLSEGPSATVYFPSRTGSDEMNVIAALVFYGAIAAVAVFSAWFLPRSIARRREILARYSDSRESE